MFKNLRNWLANLKYVAPQARGNVIRNGIKSFLVIFLIWLLVYPFALAGILVYFLLVLITIPVVGIDKEIYFDNELFSGLKDIVSMRPVIKPQIDHWFSRYFLTFKCRKCGKKVSESILVNFATEEQFFDNWNWYNRKDKICRVCSLKEKENNKKEKE